MKKNGLEKEVVILVLELAVGGELFDFMMYTGAFPEVIARTYFRQVRNTAAVAHETRSCCCTLIECTSVEPSVSNFSGHDLQDSEVSSVFDAQALKPFVWMDSRGLVFSPRNPFPFFLRTHRPHISRCYPPWRCATALASRTATSSLKTSYLTTIFS